MVGVNTRNRQSKSEEEKDEDCGACRKKVIKTEKVVLCDVCITWYHLECGGISNDLYKAIEKFGFRGTKEIPWQCRICRKYAVGLQQEILKMSQRQEKMEKKMREMEKKLDSNDRLIKEVKARAEKNKVDIEQVEGQVESVLECEREIQEIKEKLISMESQPNTVGGEEKIQREINEALQRERKRNRVVINNLIEAEDTVEEIQSKVDQLLQEFAISSGEIVQVNRLKDHRYISVEMKQTESKAKLLKRAKELKETVQYANVYIRPDLTYNQRKEAKQAREEMKMRMSKGETNLKIVRGKLVKFIDTSEQLQSPSTAMNRQQFFRGESEQERGRGEQLCT